MRARLRKQIRFLAAAQACALLIGIGPLAAAPIVGETQEEPGISDEAGLGEAGLGEAAAPLAPPVVGADATVIEFSVQPSTADPDKMETVIVVQQAGGKKICVNHNTSDLLVRAYTSAADPFAPTVPSEIVGASTGNRGQFVGFNNAKLFIKPAGDEDTFEDPTECFLVDGFEGCFVPDDEDCDQQLAQGDYVCVADVIRQGDCALGDHTDLERQLRIMLALNGPLGTEPIITAAGIRNTPELSRAPGFGAGGFPGGFGAAPSFSSGFSGSGGGELIAVPNVVGLSLSSAQSVISGAGLTMGQVTASQQSASGQLGALMIRPAYAQTGSGSLPSGVTLSSIIVSQNPSAGFLCAPGCSVSLVAAAEAAIPEPSTLGLTAVGFGMVMLVMWVSRRRTAG
jgi:hypothetical protein